MGRIGEPKREIHIPVPPPADAGGGRPEPVVAPAEPTPSPSRCPRTPVSLPWDVFATPIAARKLARLGRGAGPGRAAARVLPPAR